MKSDQNIVIVGQPTCAIDDAELISALRDLGKEFGIKNISICHTSVASYSVKA